MLYESTDPNFQQWVKGLLSDTNIKNLCITFTKSDGTDRSIHCTTADQFIPTEKVPKGTGSSTTDAVQRVFDLELGEWRSFKWDSVKQVKFELCSDAA